MKSSFKKIDKTGSSQKAFFGHPDLDAIFYNSLSKGHLYVLEEDHPTTNYLSLLRYYVSSNYHQSTPTIIYDTNPSKWKHLICPIKKVDKNEKQQQKTKQSQIAWRYNKMDINLNELVFSDDVKFLDLTKQIEKPNQNLILANKYPNCQIQDFYKKIEEDFLNCQQDQKDIRHKKILLSSLPSYFYKNQNLRQFLQALRCMTRSSHLSTLITLPPIIQDQIRQIFLQYSDFYLQIGKIGQGYTDFSSSLSILKQIPSGQIKLKNRGISLWGIKNKKKQLRIQSLYEQAIQQNLGDESKQPKNTIQF